MLHIVQLESESLIADVRWPAFAHQWTQCPAIRPAMQALADQLLENIEAFVAGTPRNRVT
jgi:hypothetical protein